MPPQASIVTASLNDPLSGVESLIIPLALLIVVLLWWALVARAHR
jgi:hypothetical protein